MPCSRKFSTGMSMIVGPSRYCSVIESTALSRYGAVVKSVSGKPQVGETMSCDRLPRSSVMPGAPSMSMRSSSARRTPRSTGVVKYWLMTPPSTAGSTQSAPTRSSR
ncbi:MAG: hypothetical protein R3F59_00155 [Myxococcota bacterium]